MAEKKYSVSIRLVVAKKTTYWIAYCLELKTFGYSDIDGASAIKDFDRALDTFFHVQHKRGKLDETLRTLGWTGIKQLNPLHIPNYSPEKRYRASTVETVEREILVPA